MRQALKCGFSEGRLGHVHQTRRRGDIVQDDQPGLGRHHRREGAQQGGQHSNIQGI